MKYHFIEIMYPFIQLSYNFPGFLADYGVLSLGISDP